MTYGTIGMCFDWLMTIPVIIDYSGDLQVNMH